VADAAHGPITPQPNTPATASEFSHIPPILKYQAVSRPSIKPFFTMAPVVTSVPNATSVRSGPTALGGSLGSCNRPRPSHLRERSRSPAFLSKAPPVPEPRATRTDVLRGKEIGVELPLGFQAHRLSLRPDSLPSMSATCDRRCTWWEAPCHARRDLVGSSETPSPAWMERPPIGCIHVERLMRNASRG